MTSEQIVQERDKAYAQIKEGKDKLDEIRSLCKHEKTFIGIWAPMPRMVAPLKFVRIVKGW